MCIVHRTQLLRGLHLKLHEASNLVKHQQRVRMPEKVIDAGPDDRGQQLRSGRDPQTGALGLRQHVTEPFFEQDQENRFFRVEVFVKGALSEIRHLGDVFDFGPVNPFFGKELSGHFQQPALRLLFAPGNP